MDIDRRRSCFFLPPLLVANCMGYLADRSSPQSSLRQRLLGPQPFDDNPYSFEIVFGDVKLVGGCVVNSFPTSEPESEVVVSKLRRWLT